MKKFTFVVLALVASLWACAPSINQQAKAHVDAWHAQLAGNNATFAEKPFDVAGWKLTPGAWTQYLVTQQGHGPAQLTYKVLEAEGSDVWLEIDRWDYGAHSVMKMLLPQVATLTDGASFVPKRLISQQGDEPAQEMPPFLLEMMARPMVGAVRVDWEVAGASEAVQVVAGRFSGAKRVQATTDSAFGKYETESWGHGAVPLTGLVKSVSTDGKYAMELVAFGSSGATTALVGVASPAPGF